MTKRAIVIFFCILVASFRVMAQDPVVLNSDVLIPDVPAMDIDSVRMPPPALLMSPWMNLSPIQKQMMLPYEHETKEQYAMRVNKLTSEIVMSNISKTMERMILPPVPEVWRPEGASTSFFYMAPFSIPFGYVPVMNSSNPFAITKVPGWAPEEDKYGPDKFPQCIKLEYDFASGTYKQVMVDPFSEDGKKAFGLSSYQKISPVPKASVTPVERAMRGL